MTILLARLDTQRHHPTDNEHIITYGQQNCSSSWSNILLKLLLFVNVGHIYIATQPHPASPSLTQFRTDQQGFCCNMQLPSLSYQYSH